MITFIREIGTILEDGIALGPGYSGAGAGINNPALEHVHDVGPLPAGDYIIELPPEDTVEHGPFVLVLTPKAGTNTYGRSGFLIHGDSKTHPGQASKGCLVASLPIREKIAESAKQDPTLRVV